MACIVVVGSLNMDLVALAPRLPHPGETLIGRQFLTEYGGKGANQAFAVAKLDGDVAMLGRVGTDDYGARMRGNLEKAGCDVRGVRSCEGSSGVAVILVAESGQNSIVVISGANERYTPSDLLEDARSFEGAKYVLLQLETPLSTVTAAVALARKRNACVILDPAPAPGALPRELLSSIDILTPNETEAALLLDQPVAELSDAEVHEAAARLLSQGPKTVILKLGARGCLLCQGTTRHWIRAPVVEAVDSTAAGDVFNGALAVASAEGATLEDACRFAVQAAALSVTRLGAQRSMPSRSELSGGGPRRTSAV